MTINGQHSVRMVMAAAHFSPTASPVSSAQSVAAAAMALMSAGDPVTVSFRGLRGISSSYFNALLVTLRDAISAEAVKSRVVFETDSKAQRDILDRSIEAVLGP